MVPAVILILLLCEHDNLMGTIHKVQVGINDKPFGVLLILKRQCGVRVQAGHLLDRDPWKRDV